MTDSTFTLVALVVVFDLVLAMIITRVISRRGYSGLRKTLLLALTWLVPGIGAICAAITMWSRASGATISDPKVGSEYIVSPADGNGAGHDNGSL